MFMKKNQKYGESNNDGFSLDLDLSNQIPSISIDYAVSERSKKNKSGGNQHHFHGLI